MTLSYSGYAVKTAKHGITKSVLGSVTQKSLKMMSTSALIAKSNYYVLNYVEKLLIPLCNCCTIFHTGSNVHIGAARMWWVGLEKLQLLDQEGEVVG